MNFKPPLYRSKALPNTPLPVLQPRLIVTSQRQARLLSAQRSSTRPKSSSLSRSKSVSKNELKLVFGVPYISAECYEVMDLNSKTSLIGFHSNKRVPIASLTKIMTSLVALQLIKEYKLNVQEYFYVSSEATNISGTSAFLRPNDLVTLIDILYGLMLPSGNDAALVIAENLSGILKEPQANVGIQYRIQPFITLMNKQAQQLEMFDTTFYNPHGLSSDQSFSTAEDISKLCQAFIKEPLLLEIVNTKVYTANIKRKKNDFIQQKWFNTNKMLNIEGYCGIKTGQTLRAGPCLTSLYRDDKFNILIVLLNCYSPEIRWEETNILLNWAKEKIK